MANKETVEVAVDYIHDTDRAWLVNTGDQPKGEGVWIPKSCSEVSKVNERKEPTVLEVEVWFAEKEGLV